MNFLENIFDRLGKNPDRVVLQEARVGGLAPTSARDLAASIRAARAFLRKRGVRKGDRCVLLAANSIQWAALDLAMMAEQAIVVPLYARQAPEELVGMMKDCRPVLICCGTDSLRQSILERWPTVPPVVLLEEILDDAGGDAAGIGDKPSPLADVDPITIIYTSGTSGEAKGVVLNVGNVTHMLQCTTSRLDLLMGGQKAAEQVFHYLPFCFAGSWILLLSCLSRHTLLTLSMDLNRLVDELKAAAPQYFLNVPTLLERIRSGIEEQIAKKGGLVRVLYDRAKLAGGDSGSQPVNGACLALARLLIFPTIRKKLGMQLKALICGSAPLAQETQLFFLMIGLPVLQVYGLTETTAICTMDHPDRIEAGRVGPAIAGTEMKLGEGDEILVRGPHIFPGYWNRLKETEAAFQDGWFRTGDQGEVNRKGNWKIIGRIKNLIILNSGHNIAPEPIEEQLARALPAAKQVVLIGNGRAFLSAIFTGAVGEADVRRVLDEINPGLPHYKRIHGFTLHAEPFTVENGLLTANGKLRRQAIAERLSAQIEHLYEINRKGAEIAERRA